MRKIETPFVKPGNRQKRYSERIYHIKLITPLVGGGVQAGKVDSLMPIRGASIRGHLRFWWRMTIGNAFANSQKMFTAESDIWGNTETPASATLSVKNVHASKSVHIGRRNNRGRIDWNQPFTDIFLQYAAFPFQGDKVVPPAKIIRDISFDLVVKCNPRHLQDVETALRAWLNFGGIGARTRRGFGSLQGKIQNGDFLGITPELLDLLPEDIQIFKGVSAGDDAIKAWSKSLGPYRNFRQTRSGKRGRSKWPEPDSIRKITGCAIQKHRNPNTPHVPSASLISFPRAQLGLPINFHFAPKDRRERRPAQKDPADCIVKPRGKFERMSSPIITKAHAIGNNQYEPLLFLFPEPQLDGIAFEGRNDRGAKIEKNYNKSSIVGDKIKLLAVTRHKNSAYRGFIAEIRTHNFERIK